ncbi:hypothetical protein BCR44DRAFT_57375, partial [Catenaria anguillulae PL171]
MTTNFNITDLEATPNAVLVQNISANATEKAVKDFFSFCGKINRFELIAAGETQEAFILFDKESAANTARLLSNAVIVDRSVTVKSFFDAHDNDAAVAVEEDTKKAEAAQDKEHKPYTRVVAELLAEGYTLSEGIAKRGLAIDEQYSITKTLTAYFFSARARAEQLDEQYKVTDKLREIDAKYHVSENATSILSKTKELADKALATPAGQKVAQTVDAAKERALEVASETRAIVDEKKAAN